ncbi:MAG: hypothetical protein K0Q73_9037 [Paenibacillus sp.]|jgi:hypothetical protein|nr:hypothetical protein [Paenibacillus sp.]
MKKTKLPGENISLKTKKMEDSSIMDWINAQTNLMDSIRYLIENELKQNGVRNLQAYVPAERSFTMEYIQSIPDKSTSSPPVDAGSGADVKDGNSQKEEKVKPLEDDIDDDDIESWT